eukprot:8591848-Pyramimonas_sp.AAC.1
MTWRGPRAGGLIGMDSPKGVRRPKKRSRVQSVCPPALTSSAGSPPAPQSGRKWRRPTLSTSTNPHTRGRTRGRTRSKRVGTSAAQG